jgi:hypothetical protein
MSIMTINAETNDGVLIIKATEVVIVTALEIAAAAPHEAPAMIVVARLAVEAAFQTDTDAIIILNIPTISSS